MPRLDTSDALGLRFGSADALEARGADNTFWPWPDGPVTLPNPTYQTGWSEGTGTTSANTGLVGGTFSVGVEGASVWGPGETGTGSGESQWTGSSTPANYATWTLMAHYRIANALAADARVPFYAGDALFSFNFWQADASTQAFEATGGGDPAAFIMPINVGTEWAHLALACDGTQTSVYQDGVFVKAFIAKAPVMRGAMQIGSASPSGLFLDNFRIFPEALTAEQILVAMNTPA